MSTTAQELVTTARSRIRSLTPAQVEAHLMVRDAVVVDIRETEELDEHGRIGGAFHAPRGVLEFWADPASPAYRPQLDPKRRTILYCAVGSRSALAVQMLQDLGYQDVAHLEGGIEAWKQAGLPVAGLLSSPWYFAGSSERHGPTGGIA